jgi:hypothetical protein
LQRIAHRDNRVSLAAANEIHRLVADDGVEPAAKRVAIAGRSQIGQPPDYVHPDFLHEVVGVRRAEPAGGGHATNDPVVELVKALPVSHGFRIDLQLLHPIRQ